MLRFSDESHIVGCSICLCCVAHIADRAALDGEAAIRGAALHTCCSAATEGSARRRQRRRQPGLHRAVAHLMRMHALLHACA